MAYEMVMPYHLHMPSYFLETFTEYPFETIAINHYAVFVHLFVMKKYQLPNIQYFSVI